MPAALDRLLTCPAAFRTARVHGCRPARARAARSFSSEAARLKSSETGPVKKTQTTNARPKPFRAPAIDRESNVNDAELARGKQLKVDNAPPSEQAALWAETLLYRERVYGLDGVRDVFFGMARRGYHLPTDNSTHADTLWSTLLKHPQLVMRVVDYAAYIKGKTGSVYPRLYEKCMAYWLQQDTHVAVECHHRFLVKVHLRELPLRRLAQIAKKTLEGNPRALSAFMDIYRTSNERDIYDEIVPMLCDLGRIDLARRWHTMCSHRKDFPSIGVASHPLVQLFVAESTPVSSSNADGITSDMGTIAKHLDLPGDGSRKKRPKYNEELMRRLTGRDTAPVRFDDTFCARLFATRAFPPSSVIKGLVLANINEIGPLALRQMGLSSESLEELPDLFRQLKASGIALQGCVFSLALEKFAMDGRFSLVRSILDSDQHPEVFDDAAVQNKLLDFYLEESDWLQAHRTLAVLALFHQDSSAASWNFLLQARIRQFHPKELVQVLQDMGSRGIMVDEESMTSIRGILRHRNKGHKPGKSTRSGFDDLRFITRCYMIILQSGIGMIYPRAWSEIIRRLGMLGRFRELRRLLFWLLNWYAPRNNSVFANLATPPYLDTATAKLRQIHPESFQYFNTESWFTQAQPNHPIRQLFPQSLLQGIIIWGFRARLLPNAPLEQSMLSPTAAKKHFRDRFLRNGVLKRLDWTIGLKTVIELRDLGVHVHQHTVVKALQMQFVVLFGRGRSKKIENRIMEDYNRTSYVEYVQKANEIWGEQLISPTGRAWGAHTWSPRAARRRNVHQRRSARLDVLIGDGWRKRGSAHIAAAQSTTTENLAAAPSELHNASPGGDPFGIHGHDPDPHLAFLKDEDASQEQPGSPQTDAGQETNEQMPQRTPSAMAGHERVPTPNSQPNQTTKRTLSALEELLAASTAENRRR